MTDLPGFLCIHHIGIAVHPGDLERHIETYKRLGFIEQYREDLPHPDHVREVLLAVGDGPNMLQLLEPLSPDSPVARQLARLGGQAGIVHVAYQVSDVDRAFEYMQENGFRIIDAAPRRGSRGARVFFVHPKQIERLSLGYLMEVMQDTQ